MIKQERSIVVNQLGYPPHAEKVAFFKENTGPFQVIREKDGKVVFQSDLSTPIYTDSAEINFYYGDFSEVTEIGTYKIQQNGQQSGRITIADNPYDELHTGLLKAFYYLRCGVELKEEFAGPWQHQPCHLSEGIVYGDEDRRLDCSGGWHDAGDYGKYVVAGAKAVADLLLAHEVYPTAFQQSVPIPETDNKIPDVFYECRVELDWLFKMQDQDGGVFHKVTTLQFPGLAVMPEDDRADLYISPVSATATGSFAAIMAMAARMYKAFDPEFANKCLHASIRAWSWLERHPAYPGFKNPPEIKTGEYGDSEDRDERYWAAAELYRTTGEEKYREVFKELVQMPFPKYELGWAAMGCYGTIAYLLNKNNEEDAIAAQLLTGLQEVANNMVHRCQTDGMKISLQAADYIWGSNMVVMNNAMLLLLAYHLDGNPDYEKAAFDHVHYLLGRNSLDISYVTGFGDRAVMNIHHRPSVGDNVEQSVPGYISGGPNKNLNDPISVEKLQEKAPAESFIDHIDSYATNEITIYWNSPALFVISHWIK